jgi:glycosyltransferase involved in cell wall biosynthesis
MRIMIVSDAWEPQINGVVRTLQATRATLITMGHEVQMVTPDQFRSVPCPTYPEIRLAVGGGRLSVSERIAAFAPDAIHLSTEGPLCLAARRWCLKQGMPFTTAYHTQFPAYVAARTGLPERVMWKYIRWFHGPAKQVLTSTESIRAELQAQGIDHLVQWGRGVDLALFRARNSAHPAFAELPRPIQLYVGRVAVEKNIEAFLDSTVPGTKVVVGDGPALADLTRRYPDVHFLGSMTGEMLASAYAGADVFVFPSRTDTFGLVLIEAMASGTPVAAYPVTGPRDIVTDGAGVLDEDLNVAITGALNCSREAAAAVGQQYSWEAATEQFLAALAPSRAQALAHAA